MAHQPVQLEPVKTSRFAWQSLILALISLGLYVVLIAVWIAVYTATELRLFVLSSACILSESCAMAARRK